MGEPKKMLILVLRWIVFLPAGLLASTIAFYAIFYVNAFTIARYVEPSSFMARLFLYWIAPCVSGVAIVYASVYIAPSHKKHVAVIVPAILLFLLGGAFLIALGEDNYWSIYRHRTFNIGSIALLH